ncbi:MAG: RNA methyltransferase [Candidatus Berkelbacteria bacterium]
MKKLPKIYLILDNIRSMENVGSIFRTCDAAGVSKLILTGITPRPPRKEIDKTALGAVDTVEWESEDNLQFLISDLKKEGFKIVALEQDSRSIPYTEFLANDQPVALIIGSETEGVQKEILDACDEIIEIPMHGEKNSLNVSVAAGIALYKIIE